MQVQIMVSDKWYLGKQHPHDCPFDNKKCKMHHDIDDGGYGHIFDCRYGKWAPEIDESRPPCDSNELKKLRYIKEGEERDSAREILANQFKSQRYPKSNYEDLPPLQSIGLRKKKSNKTKSKRKVCRCKNDQSI